MPEDTAGKQFDDFFGGMATGQPKTGPAMPMPAVLDPNLAPGVGFVVQRGATTHFENHRDMNENEKLTGRTPQATATFNPDAYPFDADGEFLSGHPAMEQMKADRWYGGNLEYAVRAWPAGFAGESEGVNAATLQNAFAAKRQGEAVDLPPGSMFVDRAPDGREWNGKPRRDEGLDLSYLVRNEGDSFYVRWGWEAQGKLPGLGLGSTPDRPMPVAATDHWWGELLKYRYFVELHPQFRTPQYYEVTGRTDISYSPRRESVPAYPQVFGAPTAAKPTPPPPAPTPTPPTPTPQPPTPTPTPVPPKTAPFSAPVVNTIKLVPTWRAGQKLGEARLTRLIAWAAESEKLMEGK